MTNAEKLKLYRSFNEGSELGDAVRDLISAAQTLNGISADFELALTILVIEKLIRDYMESARKREIEWSEYEEIDPDLYSYLLGGAKKLNRAEFGA